MYLFACCLSPHTRMSTLTKGTLFCLWLYSHSAPKKSLNEWFDKNRNSETTWTRKAISKQVDYRAGDGERTGSMNKALVSEGREGARGQLCKTSALAWHSGRSSLHRVAPVLKAEGTVWYIGTNFGLGLLNSCGNFNWFVSSCIIWE